MSQSIAVAKPRAKRIRTNGTVLFWSPDCRYEVIVNNVKRLHQDEESNKSNEGTSSSIITTPRWECVEDERYENKSNVYWIDVSSIHERFRTIQPWQVINHFPGMPNIARKNRMGQNLNKMLKLFPKEYSFYPKTWVLPGEISDFRQQFDNQGNSLNNKIFIIKPDAGCQGRGIFLTRTYDTVPQNENVVAQVYIKRPLLLDGFKFDLRLYCLVTSVKPLRMYLFQDGLVRMCTEEYEKPNKQNIAMACMHLTNYAVNKHNSNFQQPSAKTSEESQDDASKRSLKWFLNYIAEQQGEAKAAWLWRRMGTLCTRSVMSILPTLSREYDQHFKSFSGIPLVVPEYSLASSAFNSDQSKGHRSSISGISEEKQPDNEDTAADIEEPSNHRIDLPGDASPSLENTSNDKLNSNLDGHDYPFLRGSRCFEVLGFDVMIDSKLKPWIIEVNHLPSFGTDSPLDLDIKDRLMKEVLKCVAALPDDEQAYTNYHKAEASKRLVESKNRQKEAANPPPPAKKPPPPKKASISKAKSTPIETKDIKPIEVAPPVVLEPFDTGICLPERLEEIKNILREIYEKHSPDKLTKIDRLLAKYETREEEFLKYVYTKYNITPPWLLPPPRTNPSNDDGKNDKEQDIETDKATPIDPAANGMDSNSQNSPDNSDEMDIDGKETDKSLGVIESKDESNREGRGNPSNANRRIASRSLSPPSGKTWSTRSTLSSWKMPIEEELLYRQEILAVHYPKPDDEWMKREMSILTQFTRIFPPVNSSPPSSSTGNRSVNGIATNGTVNATAVGEDDMLEGREDDNDQEDEDENNGSSNRLGESNSSKNRTGSATITPAIPSQPVTYEDIMYQVFLQDKRQTLRLRCPLPARSIRQGSESDTQSLPPLERSKGYLYNTMGSNAGKGVVGWKLPPSVSGTEKKEPTKVPTQSQLEAAERLSKGLSVAEQQHRYLKNRHKTVPPKPVHPSIVMDQRPYIPTINITNVAFASLNPNQNNGISYNSNSQSTGSTQIVTQKGVAMSEPMSPLEYWAPISSKGNYNGSVLRQQMFRFENSKKEQQQQYLPQTFRQTDNSILISQVNQLFGIPDKDSNSFMSANNVQNTTISPRNGNRNIHATEKDVALKQLLPVWFNKSSSGI